MTSLKLSFPRVIRAVLIALAAGWFAAVLTGMWLARLQYDDVRAAFPPDRVTDEYNTRIDRELREGPVLLLAQVGVMAGVLAWQVAVTARHAPDPLLHGAAAGLLLALVQAVVAGLMQAPWTFIAPLVAVLVGIGIYAGWSAVPRDSA